jgi:hypothetical protein
VSRYGICHEDFDKTEVIVTLSNLSGDIFFIVSYFKYCHNIEYIEFYIGISGDQYSRCHRPTKNSALRCCVRNERDGFSIISIGSVGMCLHQILLAWFGSYVNILFVFLFMSALFTHK